MLVTMQVLVVVIIRIMHLSVFMLVVASTGFM
jgi:hypothetical protein